MKILEETNLVNYKNNFSLKQITAAVHCISDIDYTSPKVSTFTAIFKKDKFVGVVTEKNKSESPYPTLFKLDLLNNKAKFAVFNATQGTLIYVGNDKVTFKDDGFMTEKEVTLKTFFDGRGTEITSKIERPKAVAVDKIISSFDD